MQREQRLEKHTSPLAFLRVVLSRLGGSSHVLSGGRGQVRAGYKRNARKCRSGLDAGLGKILSVILSPWSAHQEPSAGAAGLGDVLCGAVALCLAQVARCSGTGELDAELWLPSTFFRDAQ